MLHLPLVTLNTLKIKNSIFIIVGILLHVGICVQAQERVSDSLSTAKAPLNRTSFYIEPGSLGTKREPAIPNYARRFSTLGVRSSGFYDGLVAGWDSRARIELRYNDIRRSDSFNEDFTLLLRQRIYLGVLHVLDPLRVAVELEDARQNNGNYPITNREANKTEMIQAYAELYFNKALGTDALGNARPISIRYGRMAFEFLDRRLIARNNWRNTTNTFTGLRLALGDEQNDWQLDGLLVQPINRDISALDRTDKERWFYALMGHWRKWSQIVTIEPYYLGLKQNATIENNNRIREIHGFGLRLYGWIHTSGFNYDLTGMYQIGKDNGQDHRAYAFTSEIGYTVKSTPLKPRVSAFFGYVSGDKNPNDNRNNRFERYFGFARPWSSDDYVVMENIVTPKLKVEFQSRIKGLLFKFDGGYSFYWLASNTDRFANLLGGTTLNRDSSGNSGKFLGHGLDFRTRFAPTPFLDVNMGYTHYRFGDFIQNRQFAANGENASVSNFLYVELSVNFLDYFRHHQKLK
ncbi:alginate export family protein [Arenibacter sp. GZD96]|uniref:alginate export family protein n=1 Tax=Aurantibrevibacter litoralis TaxID=3106030 RepID=UPI002B003421|nr:alginate export family protein [Arenibacter sp. GZD-96]MEA1785330.1 alginate export family protein [Arenibacter sp. GZD-96]